MRRRGLQETLMGEGGETKGKRGNKGKGGAEHTREKCSVKHRHTERR